MKTKSILQEAEDLVNGSRNDHYGDPVEGFKRISEIAETTFGVDITPADVCRVMISVKLARENYRHKRDNLVDTCGYLELLNRILVAEQWERVNTHTS